MKDQTSKLNQYQQEQTRQHHQPIGETQVIEFDSVEEALRCDAAQTAVPPRVAERLRDSICREPRPARAWWRRWFAR